MNQRNRWSGAALAAAIVALVVGITDANGIMIDPAMLAPSKGTPCAKVRLPASSPMPTRKGCIVREARYLDHVSVVVWEAPHEDGDLVWSGAVIEPELGGAHTARFETDNMPWWLDEARDVTGDGKVDVVLYQSMERRGDDPDDDPAEYRIFAYRKDGFGSLGAYIVPPPKWSGGGFDAEFRYEPFRWEFDGYRFVRKAPTEKPVTRMRATATSSKGKHLPDKAVDGEMSTSWCEGRDGDGLGEGLTIALRRPALLARISFATGFDAIHAELGDLWPLNHQIQVVSLTLSGPKLTPVTKNLYIDRGVRWIDYIPHDAYRVSTVKIEIEDVTPGTRWKDTCINEVVVMAR